MAKATKTVSLRIDEHLWAVCKALAKERRQSFNEFVESSLNHMAEQDRQARLRGAFAQLASEPADIEFAHHAQSEVALGEPGSSRS
jgi:hypothetical protein